MVPRRDLIFEILHDPTSKDQRETFDLVLIHGLNGDYLTTWTHETTNVCWPRDLVPSELPNARVLSFAYNADIYGNTSVAGIRGNAETMMDRLLDLRDGWDFRRPIVFVAHSLGGIVLKQALCVAKIKDQYRGLLSATHGFLLYGTPHLGADRSRWLSTAKAFAPVSKRRLGWRGRRSQLVDSLTRNSQEISDICEDFRFLARRFAIVSFYETHAWPGTRDVIVDKLSARMNLEHEEWVPLAANHLDICRFENAEDQGFRMTCGYIVRIAQGLGHGMDQRIIVQVGSEQGVMELER